MTTRRKKNNKKKNRVSRYANTVSLRDDNGNIFYVTESEYERIKKKKEEEKEIERLEQEYLQQQEKNFHKEEDNKKNIINIVKQYLNNMKSIIAK